MSGSIKARLERLEQNAGNKDNCPRVYMVGFVGHLNEKPGTLAGVELLHDHQYVERPAAEPEDDFIERVSAEHNRRWPNGLVLVERRVPA